MKIFELHAQTHSQGKSIGDSLELITALTEHDPQLLIFQALTISRYRV